MPPPHPDQDGGGTTFDDYLALNSLRNGRFEAENGATVWRAYGATAPSLLASKSLVLTCSIFPRRVPPPIRFHISVLLISSRKWCSPTGGGALPPQGSRLWGGQLPPQLLRYGGAISLTLHIGGGPHPDIGGNQKCKLLFRPARRPRSLRRYFSVIIHIMKFHLSTGFTMIRCL